MDDDPTARVNRARVLFRKMHVADGKKKMGVHEFGTYATAAGLGASLTDLVRARMALDPNQTQEVEPESFFTWLYSMLKSKKKSHLNKLLTRTLVGVQTISNRDLPGEAHAYGKPIVHDKGTAANTMDESLNVFQPSKEKVGARDWEALNKDFSKARFAHRGSTHAIDLKALTQHDKANMKYQKPYPTSRSRAPFKGRLCGQYRHGGSPARYGQSGVIIKREMKAKKLPTHFQKKKVPRADYQASPAGAASMRHLEPPMSEIVEGRLHVYDNEKIMYPQNTGLKRYRENKKEKLQRLKNAPPTKASQGRLLALGVTPEQIRHEELKQFKIKKFANVKSTINFKTGEGIQQRNNSSNKGRRSISAAEIRLNTGRSKDPMRDRLKLTARLINNRP